MVKITAIIPTFNEAHNIEEVLKSVSFADEIMVVDSFSTDNTVELAKKYTNFIVQREYKYSASQKNWAIPQANNEWILLVDADERVTPELKQEIIEVLNQNSMDSVDAFSIRRANYFMGKRVYFSGKRNDRVTRLFRKSTCRYEDKFVHAKLQTKGKVKPLKNKFYHNTYVSFDKYIEKMNRYAWLQARDYNKVTGALTPYHFIIKPCWSFFTHFIIQGGFRDGVPGLVISYLYGYSVFTRYVKLWLLRRNLV